MAWAWKVSKLLTLVALLPYRIAAEDEDEETEFSEALANSEDATGSDDIGSAQTPSSVYVMEHGVLGDEWMPRGTIMLSGHGAGYEARLSDAKEFVQMKPQLQQMRPGLDLSEFVSNLSLFILFCSFVFAVFECFRVFWVVTCCNYMKSICNYGVITSYHVLSTLVLGPWPLWLRTQIQCVLATPGCQGLPRLRARRSTMPSACTIQQVPREPYRPGTDVFCPCFSHWLQLWTALPKIFV